MADENEHEETPSETDDVAQLKAALAKANKDAERHRLRNKELEPIAAKAQEAEDAKKDEVQRLTEQIATLTKERDSAVGKADRLEVAIAKSLDEDRAQRISTAVKRLTGTTREELEADADELLPMLFRDLSDDREPPAGKPREHLRGGGDPTESPEPDVREVVESIPRGI